MTRSNPSRRIAAARTRAVVSASEPRKASSEIKTPLDAPMARALRTASMPRSGPIETTVTSPPCASTSCNPASTPNSSPGSRKTYPLALEQMRGRVELAGGVWVGDLLDADDDLHECLRVCRLGIETLTYLRPNPRIGPAECARHRSQVQPIGRRNTHRLGLGGTQQVAQFSLTPAGIGECDDPVVIAAPGEPRIPRRRPGHRLDAGIAEAVRPRDRLAVERGDRPPCFGPSPRGGIDQGVEAALLRGTVWAGSRTGQQQDSLTCDRVTAPDDRARLHPPALGRAAIEHRPPSSAQQASVALDTGAVDTAAARGPAHVFDDRS